LDDHVDITYVTSVYSHWCRVLQWSDEGSV